jgi:hypothetical protein
VEWTNDWGEVMILDVDPKVLSLLCDFKVGLLGPFYCTNPYNL